MQLARAQFEKANLSGAELIGADLSGATLHGADLENAELSGADLKRAKLHGAYLKRAKLHGTDLKNAELHGAYFEWAELSGADLKRAKLHGAYLHGAYLHGADLKNAELHGADLGSAQLNGADLGSTDWGNVKGEYVNFDYIKYGALDDDQVDQLADLLQACHIDQIKIEEALRRCRNDTALYGFGRYAFFHSIRNIWHDDDELFKGVASLSADCDWQDLSAVVDHLYPAPSQLQKKAVFLHAVKRNFGWKTRSAGGGELDSRVEEILAKDPALRALYERTSVPKLS